MSVQILGGRVDYYVYPKFERALQVRRHKSIVTNHSRAGAMRYLRHLAQIGDDHHRVRRRFDENHFRIWLDRRFDVERVRGVNKIEFQIVVRQHLGEEAKGSAVGVIGNDHVFAGFYEP